MATYQNLIRGFQVNRSLLVTGAVLTGAGAVLGLTGSVLLGAALFSAGRGWVQQLETPPSELAARRLQQARAASMAGLDAWRAGVQAPGSSN